MQFSVWKKLVMYDMNGESKQIHGVTSVSQSFLFFQANTHVQREGVGKRPGELFLLTTQPQLLWYLRP